MGHSAPRLRSRPRTPCPTRQRRPWRSRLRRMPFSRQPPLPRSTLGLAEVRGHDVAGSGTAPPDSPQGLLAARRRAMISFWSPGGAIGDLLDGLSPQRSRSWRRAADWCACRSGRAPSGQRELRRSPAAIWAANTRQGIVWPRRSSPVRGVAPTTMPNQRPRMSQPSIRTSTPVSSARHNSHRSSLFTMPATAARWGRAPASRRAAIRTSAGVGALTTPAWARAAPDDHRGRGPRKASHATATASARHRRATASGRRKCRIAR
jgi:hypothetical protein